jgi:hypothetical protein
MAADEFFDEGYRMRSLPGCFCGRGICFFGTNSSGKEILVRIVTMLTKLLMRFDPEQYRVNESASGLTAPSEHEHDDEHEHD